MVVNTLDVDVRAGSSAYRVCDSAAAAVCSVILREALMAGMEAAYGLKEENWFVHTVDEWLGHEHIVKVVNSYIHVSLCIRVWQRDAKGQGEEQGAVLCRCCVCAGFEW